MHCALWISLVYEAPFLSDSQTIRCLAADGCSKVWPECDQLWPQYYLLTYRDVVWVHNEPSQTCELLWPRGSSLHYSWVLRSDPGNKLSEALCQYETLAATIVSASNYTVDRHQHKGAERGPPPFSHTPKNESVCCRSELCLYSIYSFCPWPLFSHQWGLKCWWKPEGKDFSVAAS